MWRRYITKIQIPEWLRKNKKLQTAIAVFAAILCANLALYLFVAGPSAARLRGLELKYAELRKRQADAVLFQKQKSLFSGISSGIPTQKDMPLLVKEFVQTARSLNLRVGTVNYDIPKHGGEGITMLSIPFSAEGSYASIKRFIFEMETSDRFIGVQDVRLSSVQGGVKLDMKLVAYIKGQ